MGIMLIVVCRRISENRWTCECINCGGACVREALPLALRRINLKLCFWAHCCKISPPYLLFTLCNRPLFVLAHSQEPRGSLLSRFCTLIQIKQMIACK